MKKGKNDPSDKNVSAIELAILNGIEAYNREQQAKKKTTGETRTPEAMEEAGLKPRRRSRAKGKGTKLPAQAAAQSAPADPPAPAAGANVGAKKNAPAKSAPKKDVAEGQGTSARKKRASARNAP